MGFDYACAIRGCDTSISADTEIEVLQQVAAHSADAHGMDELHADMVKEVLGSMVWSDESERRAS